MFSLYGISGPIFRGTLEELASDLGRCEDERELKQERVVHSKTLWTGSSPALENVPSG